MAQNVLYTILKGNARQKTNLLSAWAQKGAQTVQCPDCGEAPGTVEVEIYAVEDLAEPIGSVRHIGTLQGAFRQAPAGEQAVPVQLG